MSKQDQAAKLAMEVWMTLDEEQNGGRAKFAARIRMAINSAVRKERERCVKCAEDEAVAAVNARRFVSAYRIMGAIRKGKA